MVSEKNPGAPRDATAQAGGAKSAAPRHAATAPRRRESHLLPAEAPLEVPDADALIDCGWGRLIFAQTFAEHDQLMKVIGQEAEDERDIVFYVQNPQVLVSLAPQEIFLDPSLTYRLWLSHYRPPKERPRGYFVRRLETKGDAASVNRLYARAKMVPVPMDFLVRNRNSRRMTYLVAEDETTGAIIGTATGVDHRFAFNDPEKGASLWCLAVDPQASFPGVGEALVRTLAEHYQARGRAYLDLSVMHDNAPALRLYERLGFQQIQAFTVKRKNPVNERLYAAPQPDARLNPYARLIINEARRRGIGIEIEDEEAAVFKLSFGGRTISCRESLCDLASSVAMTRCDDKALTHRLLAKAGLKVPEQHEAGTPEENATFLERFGSVVVKPARGEQGTGVAVDLRDTQAMEAAIARAKPLCDTVLIERFCPGDDLRVIVIGYRVVAAAIRRPAQIVGDGKTSVRQLIEVQSRRRAAATGGESRIPMDHETERCLTLAGYGYDDVPQAEAVIQVRKTANLHTGGTIHDVTDRLHLGLIDASVRAARALEIPVVGLDLLVPTIDEPDYVIIEANERPGLANHEPQPTAERFIDLLFPQTVTERQR